MKIAIAQIHSSADPWHNLFQVQMMAEEAASLKCDLICFPENVFYRGPKKSEGFERSQIHIALDDDSEGYGRVRPTNDFSYAVAEWLKETSLAISLGSVFEESAPNDKPFNSHWLVHPGGLVKSYKKIHLFNYESPTAKYRESDDVHAGTDCVSESVASVKFGLSICFDLRFPELFRRLVLRQNAQVLLIPAAFTRETGEAHWHTLLRCRAIENQCFVVAAGQWGDHTDSKGQKLYCYGHSLVYSPWGELVAEAPAEGDALLVADLDLKQLDVVREKLPALRSCKLA